MCPLRKSVIITIVAAALSAMSPDACAQMDVADERVAQYLADHDLNMLLVSQLELRLDEAVGPARVDLAERLAKVYAELLETSVSFEDQRRWERKSRELLREVPEAESLDLNLNLAHASYRRIEQIAERWKLRLASPAEIEVAVNTFEDLERTLKSIAIDADRRVKLLEREEESGRAQDLELLSTALSGARRIRSLAHYLAGWSLYYVADYRQNPTVAGEAMRHFGWLLNAKPGMRPELERLPDQLLKYDHVARAAIAVGMCESVRENPRLALDWFHEIEHAEELAPGIIDQLLARRIQVLARAHDWNQVAYEVARHREPEQRRIDTPPEEFMRQDNQVTEAVQIRPLTAVEARLLAVLVLDEMDANVRPNDTPVLQRLLKIALDDLVAQDELGHLLDLATRYTLDHFGTDGFISQYIRALRDYQQARDAHAGSSDPDSEPTSDEQLARAYLDAAQLFEYALEAPDLDQYQTARTNALMLLGLSLFYSGGVDHEDQRLADAAGYLLQAGNQSNDPARSADALWMAIHALDLAIERAGDGAPELEARRDTLVTRLLDEFPTHPMASSLLLRRAVAEGGTPDKSVEMLLSIANGSPVYETARRHAARLLWDLYRQAPLAERDWAAMRYVEVAEPMLAIDHRRALGGDAEAATLVSVRARRIVEALMSTSIPDTGRAQRVLDMLASLVARNLIDDPAIESELLYRRAQIALALGDRERAEALIDQLQSQSARFATAGNRLFYNNALNEWRRLTRKRDESPEGESIARALVKHGRRLLRDFGEEGRENSDPTVMSVQASVAEAASHLWRMQGDVELRDMAVALYRALLHRQPQNRTVLRQLAELAEDIDDQETALACWRSLLAGLRPTDPEYFEIRLRHALLLSRIDPPRALLTLRQHATLYPDYGPSPWGPQLQDLHQRLERTHGSSLPEIGEEGVEPS